MYAPNASELSNDWRKASASNPSGNCVVLADTEYGVGIADSKDMTGPALLPGKTAVAAWIAGAKAGEFDDLAI